MNDTTSQGRVGRLWADTLPAVAVPQTALGAPWNWGISTLTIWGFSCFIAVIAFDWNAMIMTTAVAVHIANCFLYAYCMHIDTLIAVWFRRPRHRQPHPFSRARDDRTRTRHPGASRIIEP